MVSDGLFQTRHPEGFSPKDLILQEILRFAQNDGATHVGILGFAWILSSNVRFTQRICTRMSETHPENHAFASRTNPRPYLY